METSQHKWQSSFWIKLNDTEYHSNCFPQPNQQDKQAFCTWIAYMTSFTSLPFKSIKHVQYNILKQCGIAPISKR